VTVLTITLITPSGLDVVIASAFADVLAGTLAGCLHATYLHVTCKFTLHVTRALQVCSRRCRS